MTLAPLISHDDPLELKIKRSRYSRDLLNLIFRTPGSYLGKYSFNWMAAGALADMIEAVFTSDDQAYKERKAALKQLGMIFKPRKLHFDVFRVIVNAYPYAIQRTDIHKALKAEHPNASLADIRAATDYLKEFTVKVCGFSILPDFEGGVKLADIDARMTMHIHNRKVRQGIDASEARQGVDTLRQLPGVRELPPAPVMPELEFEQEKRERMLDASD